ncbi:MAG: glycosyltransferase family 2 protein [Clostridiales bacterium]|nr:glycosyltransferase family 2 protein [Clostridiales bacterium]
MTMENIHICVCLCTFKRPDLLKKCLSELAYQNTGGLFSYSVVVVDNDSARSAEGVVQSFQRTSDIEFTYYVEPEQNIALARNRAVENARGDFIAILDDDEFPEKEWLLSLYTACIKYESDGVLGPVKAYFDAGRPDWIVKGKLCEKPSPPTGTIVHPGDTRTSNVLIKREVFDDSDNRFDPSFGRTGGEDVQFFVKVIGKGRFFVWCREAIVYEVIPSKRWEVSYYLRRALIQGGLSGKGEKEKELPNRSFPRVIAAFGVYTVMTPFGLLFGKHNFVKYLVKSAYQFAWLSGYFGYSIIRFRND